MVQWQEMKDRGFVPAAAKGVEHEPRNGIQLCKLHHGLFDAYCYYIRWMPEVFFCL
jgi:predicted restriction endonuclease